MSNFEREILDSHNKHRRNHQAPPLIWNSRLANEAQAWAERLARENRLKHADTEDGENIFMAFDQDVDGDEVTDSWYEEIKNYSFGRPGFQSNTGHFTQVVWKGSRELGAGKAVGHDGKVFVVARYWPSGNNLRTFDENVATWKKGSNWDAGWNHIYYDDTELPKLDQQKRYSGGWDSNTEPVRNRQPPYKRYSDGWQTTSISDDRSWIQHEVPQHSANQMYGIKTPAKPVKIKDDQSWIQNKGSNIKTTWSDPRKRLSNGYDYSTIVNLEIQKDRPCKMFTQTETRKPATDPWNPVARKPDKQNSSARVSNFSEPNKAMSGSGGWDVVDTKKNTGRWDPITDYNQTFPTAKWDSGKWFEPVEDTSVSVTQSAPFTSYDAWDDDYRQEPKTNKKGDKRHSGRWQPGVNDVMFKEPKQERFYSTREPLKKHDSTAKPKNIADRWDKSNKLRESSDRSLTRNGSMETDSVRFYGIRPGRGKTKESIRRWEQNAMDQGKQPEPTRQGRRLDQSNQAIPYRSNSITQSSRSTRPSQSDLLYPTNQSNRYSWPPNQSDQSTERWDPLWQEDKPYGQKERPASADGSRAREDMIHDTQMAEYESGPSREPRERKITTTIVDGPKKTVVSSLTITLKGNEGCGGKSKSSEDLRPKSSYSRGSRTSERDGYPSYQFTKARDMRSRSKSSEDVRVHSSTPPKRAAVNEDLFVEEEFKPRQNQPSYDTTDSFRAMKPLTKFPSLGQFAQQSLDIHNIYRALHGVQNLMWSPELADSAHAWAERLTKDPSQKLTPRERGGNGENVAVVRASCKNAAKEAIDFWYDEINHYNFNKPGYQPKASSFTQVVWKDTKEFGMGFATSPDGISVVVVARYRPSGNVLRRYELNVFPKVDLIDF